MMVPIFSSASACIKRQNECGIIGQCTKKAKGFLMQTRQSNDPKKKTRDHGRSVAVMFSRGSVLLIIAGLIPVILMGLVVHASYRNADKYYLQFEAGAVEIWQGTFSPGAKKRILILPGVQKPAEIKAVYTKEAVFPLAFNFYVNKADALMAVTGMPDFIGIKSYLNRALSFATSEEQRQTTHTRINQIDRMILFYKADVAATKGTRSELETALNYLDQAAALNPDEIESELIEKKKASIQKLLETL
jgi:hypothetical protein